jgi:hypothetical protein
MITSSPHEDVNYTLVCKSARLKMQNIIPIDLTILKPDSDIDMILGIGYKRSNPKPLSA